MRCKACNNIIDRVGKKKVFDKETIELEDMKEVEDLCPQCLSDIEICYSDYQYAPEVREADLRDYCLKAPILTEDYNWYGILDNWDFTLYTSLDGE